MRANIRVKPIAREIWVVSCCVSDNQTTAIMSANDQNQTVPIPKPYVDVTSTDSKDQFQNSPSHQHYPSQSSGSRPSQSQFERPQSYSQIQHSPSLSQPSSPTSHFSHPPKYTPIQQSESEAQPSLSPTMTYPPPSTHEPSKSHTTFSDDPSRPPPDRNDRSYDQYRRSKINNKRGHSKGRDCNCNCGGDWLVSA